MNLQVRIAWPLAALLIVQAISLLVIGWNTGPGWDEWGHLPSGLFTIQYGDYSPYCVNPPLARLWSSLPVWLAGGGITYEPMPSLPGFRAEGLLGLSYIEQQHERVIAWVSLARTATIPIALFGTWLIWSIGTKLFSARVAMVTAVLWAFSPTVLTFGASITPDVTAAVFGLWAAWRFYIWLRIGRFDTACWLGIAAAFAMLSKASWLILPPLLALSTLAYGLMHAKRWGWMARLKQSAMIAVVCWVAIHAMYEFDGTLVPLGQFQFVSRSLGSVPNDSPGVIEESSNRFRNSWLGNIPAPLPAAYIRGIDIQKHDFESKMSSYFFGQWRDHGWWYYYIVGMWLKEPVALWLMNVIGFVVWGTKQFRCCSRNRMISRAIVLAPGIALLVFVSSQTGFNHHLRYALPFLPCLYLVTAAGVSNFHGWGRVVAVGLVAWYAISSVSVLPRSYAYFTEAIGGPSEGWKYLGDSNLDWGQDIVTAKKWIEANPDKRPVYLVYSLPRIDFRKLGIDAEDGKPAVTLNGPTQPGWWIVSARPLLDTENRWFSEHTPTERLSVTTSVFEISSDTTQNILTANSAERSPSNLSNSTEASH